ncbi:Hypothetical_protein [Hexamita inflata]|uniref:Hypothetical_protein n=1 Tax=Hexamita inflata TaxID=28002 RepID=A0ABP1I6Z3_9EUKA
MDAYEEIIKQFLFYDEELALQTLFSITTIQITHSNQYWCHHHKTYIGDPKTPRHPWSNTTQRKTIGLATLELIMLKAIHTIIYQLSLLKRGYQINLNRIWFYIFTCSIFVQRPTKQCIFC